MERMCGSDILKINHDEVEAEEKIDKINKFQCMACSGFYLLTNFRVNFSD
jgi:hypothetical protein